MTFKSKFEETIATHFGIEDKYELDSIIYTLENRYTPDFKISDNTYLECKGFFKPSDRRKMVEVMKQHPNITFIMLFQDSSVRLTKRSKTTYGDWCSKKGIQWFCWKHKRPTRRILKLVTKSSPNKPMEYNSSGEIL